MTSTPDINLDSETLRQLRHRLDDWAHELGFQQLAVSDTEIQIPGYARPVSLAVHNPFGRLEE